MDAAAASQLQQLLSKGPADLDGQRQSAQRCDALACCGLGIDGSSLLQHLAGIKGGCGRLHGSQFCKQRSIWVLKASSSVENCRGEHGEAVLITLVLLKPMKALTQLHPPVS